MKKKKDSRTLYHKKYYRIRTLAKLRNRIKVLEKSLQEIVESPEGIAYRNRKSKEYQKEYQDAYYQKSEARITTKLAEARRAAAGCGGPGEVRAEYR